MNILRKIIHCKIFEISQENVYDEVYFSKAISLQCPECNSNRRRPHHRLFLKYELNNEK